MASKFDASDLASRLAKLPKVVRTNLEKALKSDADEWVRLARAIAPTDPEDGTPLKDSIRSEATPTGGQIVRAGGKTTTKTTPAGTYDYAVGQEFGTQNMPASPFFWTSYRSLRKKFTARRKRALSKAIKELK